jgi:hypothetical protein
MTSAQEALQNSTLFTDEVVYTLISLPPTAIWAGAGIMADLGEAFSAVIADKDEVTLVLPLDAWQDYEKRLPNARQQGEFRLITFDIELDFDLIGFMAIVSRILADVGVSILPFAAFARDHVLVPVEKFQIAWDALESASGR